jgi:hypothetical protein
MEAFRKFAPFAEVGHGNWEAWLKAEFGWKDRTAQAYMSVYETFGRTEPGSDLLSVSVSIDAKAPYAFAAPTEGNRLMARVLSGAGRRVGSLQPSAKVRQSVAQV